MPKLSSKRRIENEVCRLADERISWAKTSKEADKIFDCAVQDILLLNSSRYTIVRQPLPKSDVWYTTILPTYDDRRFKIFLRVTRKDFRTILSIVEESPVFKTFNGQKQLAVDKQLAITLYKLGFDGSGSSLSNAAAHFGIGDGGSVMKICSRVITVCN
jgi:hypothetical protein